MRPMADGGRWWSRLVRRRAAAMLVSPFCRKRVAARLRRPAMVRGRRPVRTLESSSWKVWSRTWCRRFSMPQWPLTQAASWARVAS